MKLYRAAILVTVMLAFVMVFAGLANKAIAGEVEAQVINDTFVEWTEDEATSEDVFEVWEDTENNTQCEEFATVAAFIVLTYEDLIEIDVEDMLAHHVVTAMAADLLWNDFSPMHNDCLNEE